MTQLTEEQQQRVKQIRARRSRLSQIVYTGCVSKADYQFAVNAPADMDFLLSLLDSDSQAAGERWLTCAKCGQKRAASTLASDSNFLCRFCFNTEYVANEQDKEAVIRITEQLFSGLGMPSLKERAGNLFLNALIATRSDTATRMRDKCVEKVKAMRDEWESKRNREKPLSKIRNRYDAGFCAANEIIAALESLTLDPQEPEKQ